MRSRCDRSTTRHLLAAALACGLALAACGGDDDAGDAPAVSDENSAGTAPVATGSNSDGTSTPETTDDREPDPDAVITFTYAVPSGTFDPAKSLSFVDMAYMRPVYDTLMVRAEDGTIQPGLATEWAFEGDSLVLKLREGVTFQDGTPFDASAVKANLDRQMTIDGGTQKSFLSPVDTVEVVDPLTVRLNLKGGAGALVAALTGYPGIMVSPAILDGDLTTTAVGTGPYRLDRSEPGVEAVYSRWDGAWQPEEAAAAGLRVITQADAGQRLNQIKAGDADAANMDPNLVADAEAA